MRRFAPALLCAALLLAVACSDQQQPQPTGPTSVSSPSHVEADPVDSARIVELIHGSQTLIQGLFGTVTDCTGNCNAAITKFDQIAELYTAPPPYNMAAVVSHTYDLINWILQKWEAGTLNDPPGDAGVTELVNLLFAYAGIDASICDLGTDCDFSFYQPGSPALTLTAPSGFAQLQAPEGTGTVTQPTILSVYRLTPDNDLTTAFLATQLDQYHLQYEFSTSSGETFLQEVSLTVCLADDYGISSTDPLYQRLRLAHNVGTATPPDSNIQILPVPAVPPSLNCDTDGDGQSAFTGPAGLLRNYALRGFRALFSAVTPQPLYASSMALAGSGITGSSKNLSPFGIVDPWANMTQTSPALQARLTGTTITSADADAPTVHVQTPSTSPLENIDVTFTVTAGGGNVGGNSSVIVKTDASGNATLPSWTLGSLAGANTVRATGDITPCDAPVAPGTAAYCGDVVDTVYFTVSTVPAITDITSSPATLLDGIVGVAYPGATFTAVGGDPTNYPFAWSLGSAPSWLSINSSTGQLSGTPDATGNPVSFSVTVTSGPATYTENFSFRIYPALDLSGPTSLPDGIVGVPYPSQAFTASGGDGNYTWSSSPNPAPAGLTFSSSGNPRSLGGTPTAAGTFNFSVTVTSGPNNPPGASQTKSYPSGLVINTLAQPTFLAEPSGACHTVTPAIVGSGTLADPYVTVEVRDSKGNLANGVRVHLEAVLNNGSTVSVTGNDELTVNGVAVFSSFSISKAGGYQIRASAPWPNAVVTVLSAKFKISPKC